jgi:hypothetical protein
MQTAESIHPTEVRIHAHDTEICNLPFEPPEPLKMASLPVDCIAATIAEGAAARKVSDLLDDAAPGSLLPYLCLR